MPRPPDPAAAARRRTAIVDAAAALFAVNGFDRTSAAQIARAAGVSSGTVFYHFGDKAAVFRAIFERDLPVAEAVVAECTALTDPVEAILELLEKLAADAADPHAAGIVVELLRRAGEDPLLVEVVEKTGRVERDGLAELIERAAAVGRIDPPLEPQVAAAWLLAIVDAAYLNGGGGRSPATELRRTVLGYLGAEGRVDSVAGGGDE